MFLIEFLYNCRKLAIFRREIDAAWLSTQAQSTVVNDRYIVPFLPVNPNLSATRNQARQKLAKFSAREFASLIIDLLSETRRRTTGHMGNGGTSSLMLNSNTQHHDQEPHLTARPTSPPQNSTAIDSERSARKKNGNHLQGSTTHEQTEA